MSSYSTPNVGLSLVRVHKVITRALSVSIKQSSGEGPLLEQRAGFKLYVQALVSLLNAHHLGEDEVAFPFWMKVQPTGPYEHLCHQHSLMVPALKEMGLWAAAGESAWEPGSLARLNRVLQILNGIWHSHIPVEEETMGPQKSSLILTTDQNADLDMQLSAHGQEHALPSELVMPFVLYNLEPVDRQEFANSLPPVVTQELVPHVWKDAWAPMTPFLLE
jgi:hypothetical protein